MHPYLSIVLLLKMQLSSFLPHCRIRLASGLQITHNHTGNLQLVSQYLSALGSLALAIHDAGQAREILRSSLTLAKKLNDIPTQIWVLSNLTGMSMTSFCIFIEIGFSFPRHFHLCRRHG